MRALSGWWLLIALATVMGCGTKGSADDDGPGGAGSGAQPRTEAAGNLAPGSSLQPGQQGAAGGDKQGEAMQRAGAGQTEAMAEPRRADDPGTRTGNPEGPVDSEVVTSALARETSPAIQPTDRQQLGHDNRDFAFELYRQLAKE